MFSREKLILTHSKAAKRKGINELDLEIISLILVKEIMWHSFVWCWLSRCWWSHFFFKRTILMIQQVITDFNDDHTDDRKLNSTFCRLSLKWTFSSLFIWCFLWIFSSFQLIEQQKFDTWCHKNETLVNQIDEKGHWIFTEIKRYFGEILLTRERDVTVEPWRPWMNNFHFFNGFHHNGMSLNFSEIIFYIVVNHNKFWSRMKFV